MGGDGGDAGRPDPGNAWRAATDRQHDREGAPLASGRKRGGDCQAKGRSRGRRGAKIRLVVDGAGRVLPFAVTPGQMGDLRAARGLLANPMGPEPNAPDLRMEW